MSTKKKLEQTAVTAAASGVPHGPHTPAAPARPPLHYGLSVEHAAIMRNLTRRELDIVLCLGRGFGDRRTAQVLKISSDTVRGHIAQMVKRTRMNRLQLGFMGYALRSAVMEQRAA